MDKVNWTKLEEKWRQRWIKEKDFEAEPDSREKKFITVAYPYPNYHSMWGMAERILPQMCMQDFCE